MAVPQELPLLQVGDAFPPVAQAWRAEHGAEGLLAVGADLSVATLRRAYQQGIFPWSVQQGLPFWYAPDPRAVLRPERFRLHRSLKQALKRLLADPQAQVRMNSDFAQTIGHCAATPRAGQSGTWIEDEIRAAYLAMHEAGYSYSVEVWQAGRMVGGLYGTALGRAVFGESMFAHVSDASKLALVALVAFCQAYEVALIDCQQDTAHLLRLGAERMPREAFSAHVAQATAQAALPWNETSPADIRRLLLDWLAAAGGQAARG